MAIKNRLSDSANGAKHEHASLSQERAETSADPAPDAVGTDLTLEQALQALLVEDRKLILHRYIFGLSLEAIAELWSCSLQDARRRCRELEEKLGPMLEVYIRNENA